MPPDDTDGMSIDDDDDASVSSFSQSQNDQDMYSTQEVDVFLEDMKGVRKLSEKAAELTNVQKMLHSVKRYRKSTKLSQNDDKRIIRIINGLKERK
jgi:hypothetical protein